MTDSSVQAATGQFIDNSQLVQTGGDKAMQFREWARDLERRAKDGAYFLEAYESPDDVMLKIQRETIHPEP